MLNDGRFYDLEIKESCLFIYKVLSFTTHEDFQDIYACMPVLPNDVVLEIVLKFYLLLCRKFCLFKIAKMSSNVFSFTIMIYMNPKDIARLNEIVTYPTLDECYLQLETKCIYKFSANEDVQEGYLSLSFVQRSSCDVGVGSIVPCKIIIPSSQFFPIVLLTLNVYLHPYEVSRNKPPQFAEANVKSLFYSTFQGHIFKVNQEFVIRLNESHYCVEVLEISFSFEDFLKFGGYDSSYGLFTIDTEIFIKGQLPKKRKDQDSPSTTSPSSRTLLIQQNH